MLKVLVGTNNHAKLCEFRTCLDDFCKIISPEDLGINVSVAESQPTIAGNSKQKLMAYMQTVHANVDVILTDDTGLEIDALNGEPGPLTRRWIGNSELHSDESLEEHCLAKLAHITDIHKRDARFRTVVSVGLPKRKLIAQFEGILKGYLLRAPKNEAKQIHGFPFRNIFFVANYGCVIGELDVVRTKRQLPMARELALKQVREYLEVLAF